MSKSLGRFVWCFLLLLPCGCASLFGPQGLPPDPLFANKKAIETKAIAGPPLAVPFSEPAPPVNLNEAAR